MFVEEKSKGEVPDFKLGTLRFSTAIRIGAKLRPQTTGRLFKEGASCAIGAAYEALYGEPPREAWLDNIDDANATLSSCWMRVMDVFQRATYSDIGSKNDGGWTREAIADWLEAQGQ